MLLKATMKGLSSISVFLFLLFCLSCGKIGDPMPPEPLPSSPSKAATKQNGDLQKDLNDACSADDTCK